MNLHTGYSCCFRTVYCTFPSFQAYRNTENKIKIVENRLNNEHLKIIYPIIEGMDDPKIQQKINKTIGSTVNNILRRHFYYWKNADDVLVSGCYDVSLNENNIFSINFTFDSTGDNGIHKYSSLDNLTFDITTGEIYTFPQLFKAGTNYVETINKFVKDYMIENNIQFAGIYSLIPQNQQYYLTKNNLVLFYEQFEFNPNSNGITKFSIPYSYIQGLINPQGPISKIKKML